jgi:hypothetical protein
MMLFQSVDLEGSTGFKQNNADGQNQKWLTVITDFLKEFPQLYQARRDVLQRAKGRIKAFPKLELWKVLGDELVFKAEISRGWQVKHLTKAFQETLAEYNFRTEQHRQKSRARRATLVGARLRVKGSSWTAGFPVTNAVIRTGDVYDYIGPSMDMGFRLGALATPQRLAISVELAWLLGAFGAGFPYHFAGRTPVKGVAEGVGYPRVWIEVPSSSYYEKENDIVGGKKIRDAGTLADLCGSYIQEHGAPGYLPFLLGESKLTSRPPYYNDDLRIIKRTLFGIHFPEMEVYSRPKKGTEDARAKEISEKLSRLKA